MKINKERLLYAMIIPAISIGIDSIKYFSNLYNPNIIILSGLLPGNVSYVIEGIILYGILFCIMTAIAYFLIGLMRKSKRIHILASLVIAIFVGFVYTNYYACYGGNIFGALHNAWLLGFGFSFLILMLIVRGWVKYKEKKK